MRSLLLAIGLLAALNAQVTPPPPATSSQQPNTKQATSTQEVGQNKPAQAEYQKALEKAFAPETWSQWSLLVLGIAGAFFAYHTLIATKNSADAARASAEALIRSERGLILVTMGQLPDFNPEPNRLEFLFLAPILRNYGKTGVTITRTVGRAHQVGAIGDLPEEPVYAGEGVQDIRATVTFPPDALTQPIKLGVSSLEWPAIRTSQRILYIYGFVEYADAFDRHHESRFCYLYHVPGGFNPNPAGFYVSGPEAYNRCT